MTTNEKIAALRAAAKAAGADGVLIMTSDPHCSEYLPGYYNALPWFWSDQYDLKLQIAGLSQGFDRVVTRGDIESGRSFSAFYFSGDRLIAVDAVNRPKDFMVSKRFLTERRSADPARVADESVELKDCFA